MRDQLAFGVLIALFAIMLMLSLWLKRRTKRPRSSRIHIAQNVSGANSARLEGLRGFVGKSSDIKQEVVAPSSSNVAPTTWVPTSKFAQRSHQTGAA